ncbi:MAG: hypothetical protein NZ554_14100 [Bryobacteraceae bacterium]|nr:hypothetical protein [Bryobacteraceae bacterium]
MAINRRLNLPLSEGEWRFLDTQGFLTELRCGRLALDALVEKIRQMRAAFGAQSPQRDKNGLPPDERCQALAQVIAQRILESTVAFREKHLGGRLLRENELEAWLQQQAQRDGEPSWIAEFIVRGLDDPQPVGSFRSLRPILLESPVTGPAIPVRVGGVLDDLRQLSEFAAEEYGINPAEACRTILTGLPPRITAITVQPHFKRIPAASRFHIVIDPAVTPMELARAYRDARRKYLKARVRKLSRKHLQLAAFMSARPAGEKGIDAMRAWNRTFNRWRYTHVSNFLRDAAMARRRLLFPGGLDYSGGGEK